MNLIDLLVLLLFVVGLVAGARAGFLGPVLGLIGAVGGFALALVAASVFQEQLVAIEQPMRALVTVLGIGAFVLTGEATGAAIGTTMSRGIEFSPLRPFDAVGGAVVGVAHVVLLVWVLSGMLASGMAPSIAAAAHDSVAVRSGTVAKRYLALDQGMVMGALGNLLGGDVLRDAFSRGGAERLLRPAIAVEEFTVPANQ